MRTMSMLRLVRMDLTVQPCQLSFPAGDLIPSASSFLPMGTDGVKREAGKEFSVNQPDRFSFLFVHYQLPILATVIAEKMAERHHWLSVRKTLPPSLGHVKRNAPM